MSTKNDSDENVDAIRNVRLLGKDGLFDVRISKEGRITDVLSSQLPPSTSLPPSEIDGRGKMLLPGLVDAHVHLDKCYLLDRCCASRGDFSEAMSETLQAKRGFTVEDITRRASRLIESEISNGTTLLRTHVEVDPIVGFTALDGILPLRSYYASAITLQICVFAQEGITNMPGQVELLRTALARGCDLVGSAPYVDPDPESNISTIFDLAEEFHVLVDFHLDYHLEGKPSLLPLVIAETRRRGFHHRVALGHMTYLSTLPLKEIQTLSAELRELGIAIIALPASDVCMMARQDDGNRRRGVSPVHQMAALGVTALYATNNIQNLFTFTGDGDVLKVGTLLCQLLQMTNTQSTEMCIEMATTMAAQALGVTHGIVPGNAADLLLIEGATAMEILAAPAVERIVLKRGRVVARSSLTKLLYL